LACGGSVTDDWTPSVSSPPSACAAVFTLQASRTAADMTDARRNGNFNSDMTLLLEVLF
jgi:hypothetical protein